MAPLFGEGEKRNRAYAKRQKIMQTNMNCFITISSLWQIIWQHLGFGFQFLAFGGLHCHNGWQIQGSQAKTPLKHTKSTIAAIGFPWYVWWKRAAQAQTPSTPIYIKGTLKRQLCESIKHTKSTIALASHYATFNKAARRNHLAHHCTKKRH